jgi:hypothetical protein
MLQKVHDFPDSLQHANFDAIVDELDELGLGRGPPAWTCPPFPASS